MVGHTVPTFRVTVTQPWVEVIQAWTDAMANDPLGTLEKISGASSEPVLVFKPQAAANDLALVAVRKGYRVAVELPDGAPLGPMEQLWDEMPQPKGALVCGHETGMSNVAQMLQLRGWLARRDITTRAEALDLLDLPATNDADGWGALKLLTTALQRTRDYLAAQAGLETAA